MCFEDCSKLFNFIFIFKYNLLILQYLDLLMFYIYNDIGL